MGFVDASSTMDEKYFNVLPDVDGIRLERDPTVGDLTNCCDSPRA